MKISYLFILALLLVVACQSEQQQQQKAIAALENSLGQTTDTAKAAELLQLYAAYRNQHPDNQTQNAEYAHKEAALRLRLGQAYEAGVAYLELLEQDPSAFKDKDDALFQSALDTLRKNVFNEKTNRIDQQSAVDFIELTEGYASIRPESALTPDLLFQGSDVAGAIRDYEKALAFLAKINTDYPDYKRAPQALFMRAFTLDAELKRYNEAKVLYQEFLKKYPNDELAESAQFSLKNLGKSEEEIVQGFIEKQNNQ